MNTFIDRVNDILRNGGKYTYRWDHRGEPNSREYELDGRDVQRELLSDESDSFRAIFDVRYPGETIKVSLIDSYGGEDQGTEYWKIWHFTNGTESIIYRFDGYYESHCGIEYLGYYEVVPKEKVVIVYERKD